MKTFPEGTRWLYAYSGTTEAYRIHEGKLLYSETQELSLRTVEDVDADQKYDRIDVNPPQPAPCPTCARYMEALERIASGGCDIESAVEAHHDYCKCDQCVAARALKGADHDDHE